MHDEASYKNLPDLETGLQALVDSRTRHVSSSALRRLAINTNIIDPEQTSEDLAKMAAPSTAEGPETPRAPLLVEREQTHGSFADNARVSQAIKDIFRAEPGWGLLTSVERESMDMIALKFSRILSGKSLELQHWEDVTGYAKLAEEQCTPAT